MNAMRDELAGLAAGQPSGPRPAPALATAQARAGEAPLDALAAGLGAGPFAQILLFASPCIDLRGLARGLAARLPGTPVSGCTTAGEIGRAGYGEDGALAVGLPQAHFAVAPLLVEGLSELRADEPGRRLTEARVALAEARPDLPHAFAFTMCDGLSLREDALMAALAPGLAGLPLFGGSAGDGTRFERTALVHEGRLLEDAALVMLARTDHPLRVFSIDHLEPTQTRMVVTAADAERRIVREINAEPAAREYARIVGLDPDQLDEFAFAAHPVVVRLGDSHHVRAIQRVNADGELVFFSAVDEGMVLSLARPREIVSHLDGALADLSEGGPPLSILACDCMLRRVAAEREQKVGALGAVLARHGVAGFSTYGEQVGPIHLNQTMTGIAFYPPEPAG